MDWGLDTARPVTWTLTEVGCSRRYAEEAMRIPCRKRLERNPREKTKPHSCLPFFSYIPTMVPSQPRADRRPGLVQDRFCSSFRMAFVEGFRCIDTWNKCPEKKQKIPQEISNSVFLHPPPIFTLLVIFLLWVCAGVVCEKRVQYYDCVVCCCWGFNVYIFVDLVKCGMLTFASEILRCRIDRYYCCYYSKLELFQ